MLVKKYVYTKAASRHMYLEIPGKETREKIKFYTPVPRAKTDGYFITKDKVIQKAIEAHPEYKSSILLQSEWDDEKAAKEVEKIKDKAVKSELVEITEDEEGNEINTVQKASAFLCAKYDAKSSEVATGDKIKAFIAGKKISFPNVF